MSKRTLGIRSAVVLAALGSVLLHASLIAALTWVPVDIPAVQVDARGDEKVDPFLLLNEPEEKPRPSIQHPKHAEEEAEDTRAVSVHVIEEPVRPASIAAAASSTTLPWAVPAQVGREAVPSSESSAARPLLEPLPAGKCVVFLIDCSLSMGMHNALGTARDELLAYLVQLPVGTSFQVLAFNRTISNLAGPVGTGLTPLDAGTYRQVRQRLLDLNAQGSTSHPPALRQGLALRPDYLVLITDSDDLTSRDVQELTRSNPARSRIHVVDLGWQRQRPASSPLRLLAQLTQGSYRKTASRLP